MRIITLAALAVLYPLAAWADTKASAFFPEAIVQRVRANAANSDWGKGLREQAVKGAEPWLKMSDEKLRSLMFGATIDRSWHVFSNGNCPSCKKPVPMYDWQIDALARPWKVRCPHCQELFPKNDFEKFHQSGLDDKGVFDPKKADRKLLFNTDHPDPSDPLHTFGVDDGSGYVAPDKRRWRFIPTYLVYGQWKQAVHMGIKRLASAYILTGDEAYAHKAAILLDRVADVYPTFDFQTQGILYESVRADGYVSVWHDATIETREMALAYDAIKPTIKDAKVITNIETRILKDAIANQHKIYSNYPQQHLTTAICMTALEWPANREQVFKLLDPVIEQSTAVDGTTGEKGLAGYSAYAAQRLAEFLGYYARMDDTFMPEMIKRHPRLPQFWRFFIDTWCANETYYPLSGDTGYFAGPMKDYAGVSFLKDHGIGATGHMSGVLAPSMYSFLWQLHTATKDPAFAQVLYKANDSNPDGLPFDLFIPDPSQFQRDLKSTLDTHGSALKLSSVNKEQWHIAILRCGDRAAWLDYDSGGGHGHFDGLNLGLFAKGLDLIPDFGYPPVQFGGWSSERAQWYVSSASHNTVLVNAAQQSGAAGKTTLWAAGDDFTAVTASAPDLYPGVTTKFDRTVAMIDVSPDDSYVIDIFRVAGGADHAKFFLSHFGTIETDLATEPATDFSHPQMRKFKVARNAKPGWSATWKIDDRYKLLPPGSDMRLRYTDFTTNADAYTCEAWAVEGSYSSTKEVWLPRLMIRRKSAAPVESTFVSLIEPYDQKSGPLIKQSSRLPSESDAAVAFQIDLSDGRSDLVISNDPADPIASPQAGVETDARLALIRRDPTGRAIMIAICRGSTLSVGPLKVQLASGDSFVQLFLNDDASATLLRGDRGQIRSLEANEKPIRLR